MATLYIAEYGDSRVTGELSGSAKAPPITEQTVAISGSSAQSAAFNAATRAIRVHTDVICSILVGVNPTATATKSRMAADQTEYYDVNPGDKIAVISNT